MEINKEKIQKKLKSFFDEGENANQATEIVNVIYSPDTVAANNVQLWFQEFFYVKDALCTDRPVSGNVDKS